MDQQAEDKPAAEEALREAEPESAAPAGPATKDLPIDEGTTLPIVATKGRGATEGYFRPGRGRPRRCSGPARGICPQDEDRFLCRLRISEMDRSDKFCHACGWDRRVPPTPPPQRPVDPNPSPYNRLAALLLCLRF